MRDVYFGRRRFATGAALLLAVCVAGCGRQMAQVTGTVSLDNGTSLTRGLVVFEGTVDGKPVMARGEVKADGRYQLGTAKPTGHAPVGLLIVVVASCGLMESISNVPGACMASSESGSVMITRSSNESAMASVSVSRNASLPLNRA